ncbi:cytochrome P450 [Amycolatopsis sp. NPDC051061]|uniref:cytochrome P450 n=1 Tax=Amycolatopsis sp. NPDC051061 TaxID=3155042 RepID=UPI0034353B02
MTTTLESLPEYPAPRAKGCPFDPSPEIRGLQKTAPLTRIKLWDGSTPWLVTRHEDVRALLSDRRVSADPTRDGYPSSSPAMVARRTQARTFISMDDPDHARLRRMVTAPFAIKRIEALRPAVQRVVDQLLDDLLAGPKPVDLVQAFALPVPSLVICELLGVPYADHGFFQENSRLLVKRDAGPAESVAAQQRLIGYLDDLIGRKLAEPADDLLSDLAARRVRTGELTRRDAAAMGMLLLVAGHETTANMIALGTAALLRHPDQLTALRETDDPKLVAGAVEELLRYLTIVHMGRRRVALDDIEYGGETIRAGEGIVLAGEVGNRDPAVFADPDKLDITRDARRHVAFGVHQCLGQPLARVELQVAYSTLFRRIPALSLATGIDELPFKHDGQVYGVYELPVTW